MHSAYFQQKQFWGLLWQRRSKPQNWFHNENSKSRLSFDNWYKTLKALLSKAFKVLLIR